MVYYSRWAYSHYNRGSRLFSQIHVSQPTELQFETPMQLFSFFSKATHASDTFRWVVKGLATEINMLKFNGLSLPVLSMDSGNVCELSTRTGAAFGTEIKTKAWTCKWACMILSQKPKWQRNSEMGPVIRVMQLGIANPKLTRKPNLNCNGNSGLRSSSTCQYRTELDLPTWSEFNLRIREVDISKLIHKQDEPITSPL